MPRVRRSATTLADVISVNVHGSYQPLPAGMQPAVPPGTMEALRDAMRANVVAGGRQRSILQPTRCHCHDCNRRVALTSMYVYQGRLVCVTCANAIRTGLPAADRGQVQPVILNYGRAPQLRTYKLSTEPNAPTFGIELEIEKQVRSVEVLHQDAKHVQDIIGGQDKVYFTFDGSVAHGYEMKSHPVTLDYFKTHFADKWEQAFEWLASQNYQSYNAQASCGLHIHINRSQFGTSTANDSTRKLVVFFCRNQMQLKVFGKRNGRGEQYCPYPELGNLERYANGTLSWSERGAINLQGARNPTYEVRIWRGTLNFNRVMANLEFCHALTQYITAYNPSMDCIKGVRSWQLFCDYIDLRNSEHNGLYSKLIAELNACGIWTLSDAATESEI